MWYISCLGVSTYRSYVWDLTCFDKIIVVILFQCFLHMYMYISIIYILCSLPSHEVCGFLL